jgi:serine/threonine protein kinase
MLPFDSDDNKETARQTIYDPVPFDHPIWNYVSGDAKDLILSLLEKDRFKRISLEEVLSHPWICKRSQDVLNLRKVSDPLHMFEAFSTTTVSSSPTSQE